MITSSISSETDEVIIQLELFQEADNSNFRFVPLGDRNVQIYRGDRSEPETIAEFFYDNPPVIWFADGSNLEGNEYTELKNHQPPFNAEKITILDWSDTDIRKEAQGAAKDADSIQAKLIRELRAQNHDMIIDDHSKGEAADIVAIRLIGDDKTNPTEIALEFYHCKRSGGPQSGSRLDDLYEVCGQAQKSVLWAFSHEKSTDLFTHLLRREAARRDTSGPSRLEVGSHELLVTIREMSLSCPISLKIFIAQPGFSKSQASREQLELLSVTENYLMETYRKSFGIIASA